MITKIATDLEQSKKLAEILPLESADMYYDTITAEVEGNNATAEVLKSKLTDYPCWSLAALLNVLPKQIGRYTKTLYWFDDAWHCEYVDEESEGKYGETAVNPVDACVEMIIKLKEDNLL